MKKITSLLLVLLMLVPVNVMAEDKEKKDGEEDKKTETIDDLVTDLPIDKEVEGSIFGSIYKKEDDIIIDIPSDPNGGGNGQNGNNNNNGSNNNNGNNGNNGNNSNQGNNGNSSWNTQAPGNIPDSNQGTYHITSQGTDSNNQDIVYYKWVKEKKTLDIYPAMYEKAKKEKKNIVMRILSEDDRQLQYRLRIQYEDFKEEKISTAVFVFGDACEHKDPIRDLLISAEARTILQCKQEEIPYPVYVGVSVPEGWSHDYGVYQYEYLSDKKELSLIRKDLQIDEENVVEVKMAPGKDYVFYHHILPVEKHDLLTWISGLSGKSQIVHQSNAILSTILFLAGFSFIGFGLYTILDQRRKKLKTSILEKEEGDGEAQ